MPLVEEYGQRLASVAPQGLSLITGMVPVNTSWPFPRQIDVYENGVAFSVLGNEVFASKVTLKLERRFFRRVWASWGENAAEQAIITSWFSINRIIAILREAGYTVT
ncbi:hypothetical protein [Humibacter sp.]|uniref:hypothetical protein n=1 Tax=Humibacter sp. TaxID=1940291 RepID=UPI003F7CD874